MNISQDAKGGNNNDLSLTQQHNLFHGVLAIVNEHRDLQQYLYSTATVTPSVVRVLSSI